MFVVLFQVNLLASESRSTERAHALYIFVIPLLFQPFFTSYKRNQLFSLIHTFIFLFHIEIYEIIIQFDGFCVL